MSNQPAWILIVAAVIVIPGAILAIWSLSWDRARGRRRCPRCWYDMSGSTPGDDGFFTCPECGRARITEKGLARTRRRWWFTVLAVIIVAAGLAIPKVHRDGPVSLIPSWAIVILPAGAEIEWFDDFCNGAAAENWIARELSRRAREGRIADAPMRYWLGRVEDALRKEGRYGIDDAIRAHHEKMHSTIIDRDFVDAHLADILSHVEQQTGLTMNVDRTSPAFDFDAAKKWPGPPVQLRHLSAAVALNQLTSRHSFDIWGYPEWTYDGNGVVIGSERALARHRTVTIIDVDDLLARVQDWYSEEDAELDSVSSHSYTWDELCEWLELVIMDHIRPEHWADYGGALCNLSIAGHRLILDAPPRCQLEVEELLSRLRAVLIDPHSEEERAGLARLRGFAKALSAVRIEIAEARILSVEQLAAFVQQRVPFEVAPDLETLELLALDPREPLLLPAGRGTLRDLLDNLARAASEGVCDLPTWDVSGNRLLITCDDPGPMASSMILYNVGDLIEAHCRCTGLPLDDATWDSGPEALYDLVEEMVGPETWRDLGGDLGTLSLYGPVMIITHTPRHHLLIDDLLTRLDRIAVANDSSYERKLLDDIRDRVPDDLRESVIIIHDIGDLIEPDAEIDRQIEELTEFIYSSVDPERWWFTGGDLGNIVRLAGTLVIVTSPDNQLAIAELLERLREREPASP
jgi:hypothetical protein